MKKLLTIDDAFRLTDRGWVLEPGLDIPPKFVRPNAAIQAEIRNGATTEQVDAFIEIAHASTTNGPRAWVAVRLTCAEKPSGEVWVDAFIADQFSD